MPKRPFSNPRIVRQALSNPRDNLPYDPEYEAEMDSLQELLAQITSGAQLQKSRANTDFLQGKNRLGTQRDELMEELEARMADQGILRSGININEQTKLGRRYQDEVGDLTQQSQRTLEDISRAFLGGKQQILSGQRQADTSRMRRYAGKKLESDRAIAERIANQNLVKQLLGKNAQQHRDIANARRAI